MIDRKTSLTIKKKKHLKFWSGTGLDSIFSLNQKNCMRAQNVNKYLLQYFVAVDSTKSLVDTLQKAP